MAGENCSDNAPMSGDLFTQAGAGPIVAVVIGACCTVTVVATFIFEAIHLLAAYQNQKQAFRVLWLLGLYPFLSVTSFLTICMPRTAFIVDFVNTLTNVFRIYLLLLQFIIVPPLFSFILGIVAADSKSQAITAKEMESSFVSVRSISTMLAFYGLILISRMTRVPLAAHSITQKFALMKLAVLFGHVQILVFNVLAIFGVVTCDSLWSSAARAIWINACCIPPEMLLLLLLARRVYRADRRPLSEYSMIPSDNSDGWRSASTGSVLFGE